MFWVLESFWRLEMEDFEGSVFPCLIVTTEVDLWCGRRGGRRQGRCKLGGSGLIWSRNGIQIHTSENAPLPKSCNTLQSLRAGCESQR